MAKIIDFNDFKAKHENENSSDFHSSGKTNDIFNFDVDLDLDDEWDNSENQHSEAKSSSYFNNTFTKLFKAILILLKKFSQQKT